MAISAQALGAVVRDFVKGAQALGAVVRDSGAGRKLKSEARNG